MLVIVVHVSQTLRWLPADDLPALSLHASGGWGASLCRQHFLGQDCLSRPWSPAHLCSISVNCGHFQGTGRPFFKPHICFLFLLLLIHVIIRSSHAGFVALHKPQVFGAACVLKLVMCALEGLLPPVSLCWLKEQLETGWWGASWQH